MGAAVSCDDRLPAKIDLTTYQKLVGNSKEMEELFNKFAIDGCMTRDIFVEHARKRTHVFLTHDWGKDETGRDNHERVAKVNDWLKANGVITWFDTDRMTGRVVQTMFDGIDNCCVVVVFVTRNYIDKVGGKNGDGDNCLKELNYADMRKTTKSMHVVVHEAGCRNPKTWDGTMGLMAGKLYDDNVDDDKFDENMPKLLKTIKGMISPELFALTTIYGDKVEAPEVVMLAPVETTPLLGLTDEEEEKKEEDGMFEWLRQYASEIPSKKARKTAHAFVKHELTIKKIAKKMEKSMAYLKDNFDLLDDDDIEEFVNGLKQAGLLGGTDAVTMTPSSPGGVMVASSSAPHVMASVGVSGTIATIDPTEADAIGADLISEYNLCVANLPVIEKYELKAANVVRYQALVKEQKLEEAKAMGIEIKAMGPCAQPEGFASTSDVRQRIFAVRNKIDTRRLALLADVSDFDNLDRAMVCTEYGVKVDAFIKEKGWLFEGIKDVTLTGHTGNVFSIIQLVDGRICTGSQDKTMKLWMDGNCTMTLTGHYEHVWSVIQLSNLNLCSGSEDNTIKFWNVGSTDFSLLFSLEGHSGPVYCVIELSDKRVCSCSGDWTIKIWKIESSGGSCLATLSGHSSHVLKVIELMDGRICSCGGGGGGVIKIWSIDSHGGNCIMSLKGHSYDVWAIIQLSDGRICSGSADNSIMVWRIDSSSGTCIMSLKEHSVFSLTQLMDGRICSGSGDHQIKVWAIDSSSGSCVNTLEGADGPIWSLLQLSDGRLSSGGDGSGKMILWK